MYKPKFNQVLVEVDTSEDKWGGTQDDKIGGPSYREGKLLEVCEIFVQTADYPLDSASLSEVRDMAISTIGKTVMWNEGHEAGKTFEHDGKLYALIYWWDIVAEKVEDEQAA
jgi:hypothetical protein